MNRCVAAAASVAALALALGGCAGNGGGKDLRGETLTVYLSTPLHGERAAEGRAIANGARLALANAGGRVGPLKVRAVYLDDTEGGQWGLARSAANARRAAEDVTAIGYLGDLDSGATRASLPITNQAEMVQISPGSTAVDLTRIPPVSSGDPDRYQPGDRRTFARVVPADDVQGRAAAVWAKRMEPKRVAMVNDGTDFGRSLGLEFRHAAANLGLAIGSVANADLVYYGGSPGGIVPRVAPGASVIGSDALLSPALLRATTAIAGRLYVTSPFIDPSLLPPRGRRFVHVYRKRFRRPPNPAAAYGYESMALLLDAIRRAGGDGDDRHAVIDEVLSTQERHSVLGTYSIDGNGDTTLDTVSGYRVSDGLPVFPVELKAPR